MRLSAHQAGKIISEKVFSQDLIITLNPSNDGGESMHSWDRSRLFLLRGKAEGLASFQRFLLPF